MRPRELGLMSRAPGLILAPMQNDIRDVSASPLESRPALSPASSPVSPNESTSQVPSTAG